MTSFAVPSSAHLTLEISTDELTRGRAHRQLRRGLCTSFGGSGACFLSGSLLTLLGFHSSLYEFGKKPARHERQVEIDSPLGRDRLSN
jgi:hypothetical protein